MYEVVGNGANVGGGPETVKKLNAVITGHSDYIFDAIKQPVVPFPPPSGLEEIIHEDMDVGVLIVVEPLCIAYTRCRFSNMVTLVTQINLGTYSLKGVCDKPQI